MRRRADQRHYFLDVLFPAMLSVLVAYNVFFIKVWYEKRNAVINEAKEKIVYLTAFKHEIDEDREIMHMVLLYKNLNKEINTAKNFLLVLNNKQSLNIFSPDFNDIDLGKRTLFLIEENALSNGYETVDLAKGSGGVDNYMSKNDLDIYDFSIMTYDNDCISLDKDIDSAVKLNEKIGEENIFYVF
jgi:hypothetical protein